MRFLARGRREGGEEMRFVVLKMVVGGGLLV